MTLSRKRVATRAVEALVSLAKYRKRGEDGELVAVPGAAAAAAEAIATRLEDDPVERTVFVDDGSAHG